jgi:tetratricopeptide (TPR) repeat protein
VTGFVALALLAASVGRQYVAARYAKAGAERIARAPGSALGPLRKAVQLDPYSLTTLYSLAAAYAELNQYSRSRATLLLAAEREPHNYVTFALLGDLATRHGDSAVAAGEYRRALELNPRDPIVRQAALHAGVVR